MDGNGAGPVVVVNIVSVSYSGSTWVNLLLGSHSDAFSVGEIKSILKVGKAVCTLHGDACELWSRFDPDSGENPFLQIARLTGKRYLIVNNSRKFLHHQQAPGVRSKFVHLVRDGRAVTASMLRKKTEPTMWHAAKTWAHDVRRNQRLVRRQGSEDRCSLIYERIKADPESQLRRLCGFIGFDYEQGMQQFWGDQGGGRHFLGGNRGTLVSLAQKQEVPIASAPERKNVQSDGPDWDLDYYKKADPAAFVDERWKKELSDGQLRVFGLVAGRVNRKYGYAPSLDRG